MTRAENDELEWVSSPEDAAELNKTSRSNNSREHDLWLENPIRLITQRLHGAIRNWLHNKHDEETLDNKLSGDMHPEPRLGLDKGPLSIAEKSTPRDTTHKPKPRPRPKKSRPIVIESDSDEYQLPPLTLLNETPLVQLDKLFSKDTLIENSRALEGVLDDFGISGQIIDVRPGPVVTLYELEPAPGLKSSRVIGLADDIARSMSAVSARVAVVPGRNAIGIELPNEYRQTVFLHEIFSSKQFTSEKYKLALALGKDIGGEPIITDLARMPHLLIAGTTGSGKSVGINAMILSLLYRMKPEECRLIMIDPKMLELSVYDGIPHLLSPVVTDPSKAVVALKWAVREMESRYKKMSKLGVRSIDGFNSRAHDAIAKGEVLTRTVQTGFDRDTGKAVYETEEIAIEPMPYIVVVVDEMADLMMVAGKDIEGAIQRLAQMARAAGIHLIMATQRPSVDVITGTIKANFPTRISFQVTSKIDSRTILGEQGAEQLLGQGDMLFMAGGGRISRIHGAFITDEEVETVVQFLKRQGVPEYLDAVTAEPDAAGTASGVSDGTYDGINLSESDQLYDKAVAIVARDRKASTSYIQRRLSIGYNRAATIIERMEDEGVIGVANHSGKREVLAPEPSYDE
jgi:S-DNA-T family DNA segregation ATPase FtsK/SpoIIIE